MKKNWRRAAKTEREEYCVALLFRRCLPFCFAEENKAEKRNFSLSVRGEKKKSSHSFSQRRHSSGHVCHLRVVWGITIVWGYPDTWQHDPAVQDWAVHDWAFFWERILERALSDSPLSFTGVFMIELIPRGARYKAAGLKRRFFVENLCRGKKNRPNPLYLLK